MPTFPQAAVPVFPAGYGPLPADIASWVTTPFSFLAAGVVFRAQQTAVQALAANGNILQYNSVLEDPYGGWSAVATGSQAAFSWLAPYTGWYEITVTLGTVAAAIFAGGAVFVTGGAGNLTEFTLCPAGTPGGGTGHAIVPLVGGFDYVQGGCWVSAAVNTDIATAGRFPSIEIAYLSSG